MVFSIISSGVAVSLCANAPNFFLNRQSLPPDYQYLKVLGVVAFQVEIEQLPITGKWGWPYTRSVHAYLVFCRHLPQGYKCVINELKLLCCSSQSIEHWGLSIICQSTL